MAASETTKWTYEDLELLPADGKRHEIIDGEHSVNPAPVPQHQIVLMHLLVALATHVKKTHAGIVLPAPLDVMLSNENVVEPDILFISRERMEIIGPKYVMEAPDLLVEVLSPSSRKYDEIVKRKLYEQHGVREYWVVDPDLETVRIYRGAERVAELEHEKQDTLTTPLLPGLAIPLAEIFS
jgi:Uma2 family endonuclease